MKTKIKSKIRKKLILLHKEEVFSIECRIPEKRFKMEIKTVLGYLCSLRCPHRIQIIDKKDEKCPYCSLYNRKLKPEKDKEITGKSNITKRCKECLEKKPIILASKEIKTSFGKKEILEYKIDKDNKTNEQKA